MKKKINIAIVGLGNIGSSLYKHLIKNKKRIKKKKNINLSVEFVSAKNRLKKRKISIPKNKWLKNYMVASTHPDVDIVVELIGGSEGAAKEAVQSIFADTCGSQSTISWFARLTSGARIDSNGTL